MKLSGKFVIAGVIILTLLATVDLVTAESSQSPFGEETIDIFLDNQNASVAATSTTGYPCEGNVNCHSRLNVRIGPWGRIIDGYAPGTKVTIVAREGDWYKIKYGSGFAYVHISLIDTAALPASDGPNKSPYAKSAGKSENKSAEADSKQKSSASINGPNIPDCLLKGLAAAKRTRWFTTKDKCLQFAGTVAYKAGARVSQVQSIYPHNAYKADKSLRGSRINTLDNAALAGKLKPGMLIHVKAAYDKDPAYNPVENAHHWFVYMGLKDGTPMFADTLRDGRLQTIDEIDRNMRAGRILKSQYKSYGNIRRVTAIYDPFADQR